MGEAGKIGEALNEGEREIVIGNSLLLYYYYFLLLINGQNDFVLGKTYCAALERKGLAQFFFK